MFGHFFFAWIPVWMVVAVRHSVNRFFYRADGIIMAVVALLAIGLGLFHWLGAEAGVAAVVTTPEKQESLHLSRDARYTIMGKDDILVVLEVSEGRIRFEQSGCPDQICVRSGWLSAAGDMAACVPAGVAVRVTGTAPVDMVAG